MNRKTRWQTPHMEEKQMMLLMASVNTKDKEKKKTK